MAMKWPVKIRGRFVPSGRGFTHPSGLFVSAAAEVASEVAAELGGARIADPGRDHGNRSFRKPIPSFEPMH